MDFRPINYVIALVFIAAIVTSCGDNRSAQEAGNIAQSLSGYESAGFARADAPREPTDRCEAFALGVWP